MLLQRHHYLLFHFSPFHCPHTACMEPQSAGYCCPCGAVNVQGILEVSEEDSAFRRPQLYDMTRSLLLRSFPSGEQAPNSFLDLLDWSSLQLCIHSHRSPWTLNKLKLWFLAWRSGVWGAVAQMFTAHEGITWLLWGQARCRLLFYLQKLAWHSILPHGQHV